MERRLVRPPTCSAGHEIVDVDPALGCQGPQLLDVVGLDTHAGLQAVVALANNVIAGAVGELAAFGAVEEPPHVDKADRLRKVLYVQAFVPDASGTVAKHLLWTGLWCIPGTATPSW